MSIFTPLFRCSRLIPPTAYCGGWLCFTMAIGAIGVLTCAICDFAELFGCVTGLEDSITAITIVALGTSFAREGSTSWVG